MDIMKDCFTNVFLEKLRQMGYAVDDCNGSKAIFKGETPYQTYLCSFKNDFSFSFDKRCSEEIKSEIFMLNRMCKRFITPYKEYAAAEPFTACDQKNVRKLCEYKNIVLAAQLMGKGELHFVTWQYSYDRTAVGQGHYFGANYEAAQEDFAIRSGLIKESNVLSKKQAKIVEDACVYRSENDGDMSYDYSRLLDSTIEKLRESTSEHDTSTAEKRIISKWRDDAR